MAIFLENPIPGLAIGAVLITFCGLIFLSKRSLPALIALAGVVVLTILMLVAEIFVVTEREAVELALAELLIAIEENDTPAALERVDPVASSLREKIELLMPTIKVSDTKATGVSVELNDSAENMSASSRFKGKLQGVHVSSGMQVFYFDDVEMNWIKRNQQWLLVDFTAYHKGQPLNAVKSAQGNRIAPVGR